MCAIFSASDPAPGDDAARTADAIGDLEWLSARHAEGKLVNDIRWEDGGLLPVAVRNNRIDALELLLDCGLNPDERVSSGEGDWTAYSQGYPVDSSGSAVSARIVANLEEIHMSARKQGLPAVRQGR